MLYRCNYRGKWLHSTGRDCGQRRALPKPIEQYVRRPHCLACGRDSLRLDPAQTKRNRRQTCKCNGVPYPHNRGTIIGCEHYDRFVSEENFKQHLDELKEASKKGGCRF